MTVWTFYNDFGSAAVETPDRDTAEHMIRKGYPFTVDVYDD